MADANKTALYIKRQTAFGATSDETAAAAGGSYTITPTSESLGPNQSFTNSQRIRSDRQIDDSIRNSVGASGDINVEWSYGWPYTGLLAAGLQASTTTLEEFGRETPLIYISPIDAATTGYQPTDVTVASSTTITLSSGPEGDPTVGNFLRVVGFSETANTGVFRVASYVSPTVTIAGATLTTEAAGNYVQVVEYQGILANGTASATSTGYTHATGWDNTPVEGDWIYVRNFVGDGNNGLRKVTAATSTTITTEQSNTGGEAGVAGIDIVRLAQVTNGTTLTYHVIDRIFEDAAGAGSDLADIFVDMAVAGFSLSVTPDGPTTGTISFTGSKQEEAGTAGALGSYLPQTTQQIYTGTDHVEKCWLGGTEVEFSALNLNVQNNLRQRRVCNAAGAVHSIGSGQIEVSGSITLYLDSNTEYAKALANTASTLAFALVDEKGLTMVYDLPKIRYGEPRRVAGGVNTDVMLELPFTAVRDDDENVTIRIAKY